MSSFLVLRTRLSVCFLSSLPVSLPQLFHRCFPFAFAFGLSPFDPFPFVRFSSGSYYSASVSSFPLSSRFPLTAGLLRCCLSAFQLPCFSTSVPPGFPCFPSVSSYSAFCLFPFIPPGFAPTAVPPVLPFCFRFRAFPLLPLSFVRFRSVLTTQPSVLSFPFFPFSPVGGSSGASFLFRPTCFHVFLPIPVLSFLHFFSPVTVSPHSSYLSASAFFLSVSGFFPFAFALGSGYLALGMYPFQVLPSRFVFVVPSATLRILPHAFLFVNNFFHVSAFLFIFHVFSPFFCAFLTTTRDYFTSNFL